jgi:exodeoxyribonuclease VII large subunit
VAEDRKIFSLSKLTKSLEIHFLNKFGAERYWITAELTKINEKNGNYYLELADSDEGKLVAKMQAALWRSSYTNINAKIGGELASVLRAGNKVLLQVRLEYRALHGLSLNIIDVDPSITYGEIERKKKETVERLKKEGLYALQHQLYLPKIIKRIALIGSPQTSGHRDFLTGLFTNDIYTKFSVKEFPCSVQGDRAKDEIVEALKDAAEHDVEVIVLLRGGGSKMDLNVFNDYEIAKAICNCPIPVMTGIGHETDEVVADLVARIAHITPTATAEFLYNSIGVFSGELRAAFDAVLRKSMDMLAGRKDEFNHTNKFLVFYTQHLLTQSREELSGQIHGLQLTVQDRIAREKSELSLMLNQGRNYAVNAIELVRSTQLNQPLEKAHLLASGQLERQNIMVSNLSEKLEMLNPLALLKHGYTISTIDDIDVNQYEGELIGKELKTLTDKQLITGKITKVEKTDGEES